MNDGTEKAWSGGWYRECTIDLSRRLRGHHDVFSRLHHASRVRSSVPAPAAIVVVENPAAVTKCDVLDALDQLNFNAVNGTR